jgi:hypothetical protein
MPIIASPRWRFAVKCFPSAATGKGAGPRFLFHAVEVRDAALRHGGDAHPTRAGVDKLDLTIRKLAVDPGRKAISATEVVSNNAAVLLRHDPSRSVPATPDSRQTEAATEPPYAIGVSRIEVRNWSARLEASRQDVPVSTVIAPLGLKIDAKGVDVLPLQPYIADGINLRLTRGSLSADGGLQLRMAGGGTMEGGFRGDVALGNLAAVDKLSGDDFLRWKSLFAGGVDLRLQPFGLAVDELALSDFFARVIIDSSGRVNLQDILRGAGGAPETDRAMPPLAIRKLTLQGGRVRFTDNFIKPNYSATLADIGGAVTGLSSDPDSRAGVELRGAVSGAPLALAGSINALRGDLFMDIKAGVRGMELAPLSAYSGRYVGYGIEKGKLSFEASYRVDKRTLTADNRLILDQLTFGDRVESPDATRLPVQFAVALLRDGNGVIDLNLPIAGSLDDPEFSVGGVLVKALANAIAKTAAQPFALLSALFSGGAELSSVALEPGRFAIPAAGTAKLQALAKALAERPALKLDVSGRFDPELDREALKRVAIERKVRALKIREMRARGESPLPGSVVVLPEEYRDLLARAFRDENFPKPRNLLGLPKDLPVEEMEKLMIAHAEIDDDDLIVLGTQRAQSVKNWLHKNGQIPAERIFLLAPRAAVPELKGRETIAAHRVDFSLR